MTKALRDGYHIGVDVGGTFTDVLCIRPSGDVIASCKVPSIPGQQWRGVLQALAESGLHPTELRGVVHGTTIATNTILERKGARTALITTKGFRDAIEIGRTRRMVGGLFDFCFVRPQPLVARRFRFEIDERTATDGTVLNDGSGTDWRAIAEVCRSNDVESVAIGFINSYANVGNERTALDRLRETLPAAFLCTSTQVSQERGEFERFSSAILNAYVGPVVNRYLDGFVAALKEAAVDVDVEIMGSHGGSLTLDEARRNPVRTFLSGPVGGAVGASAIAKAAGIRSFLTFDMGGTSTDVGVFPDGNARMSFENQIDAFPLRVPQIDLHTIGAGGGSIAHRAADGTLEVGPASAGADPGPACYGRGGVDVTVSDANVVLGRLPSGTRLGGHLALQPSLATEALTCLGQSMGTDDIVRLADGAIRIAVAKMAGAVREVTVHRGHDPRAFDLIAFGGAGPMHAFFVAEELGIPRVIVPRWPGHLSALGQLSASRRYDYVRYVGKRLSSIGQEELRNAAEELLQRARNDLDAATSGAHGQETELSADARYVGQSFTLAVPMPGNALDLESLRAGHRELHTETFGYADDAGDLEIVSLRLVARTHVAPVKLAYMPAGADIRSSGMAWFGDDWHTTPVIQRDRLPPDTLIDGPALIEEDGATTVLPPGWRITVDPIGNLIGTPEIPFT